MKQIGMALHSYANDFDGWAPSGLSTSNYLYNYSAQGGIREYLGVSRDYDENCEKMRLAPPLSRCPAGGRDGTTSPTLSGPNPNFSYSINVCLGDSGFSQRERITTVRNPSGRMLTGESGIDGWFCVSAGHARSLGAREGAAYRHFRKSGVIFTDGHLESRAPLEIPVNYLSKTNDPDNYYTCH
jgi:hypothetical protein